MVGLIENLSEQSHTPIFSIAHQKVELDIDILSRSLHGRTEITVNPHIKELRTIKLNCRQCAIKRVLVNGKLCSTYTYDDPYAEAVLPWDAGVEQWHMLKNKVDGALKDKPQEELIINFPKSVKIEEQDPLNTEAQQSVVPKPLEVSSRRESILPSDLDSPQLNRSFIDQSARFLLVTISVEYVITTIRDGMHFVGWEEGDLRYPHAYSKNILSTGAACCLYPCVDSLSSRCTWELSIKCSKTIGDALKQRQTAGRPSHTGDPNGIPNGINGHHAKEVSEQAVSNFSEEDSALDLTVVATGDMTDEIADPLDPTKKTTTFLCLTPVSPWHVGFAIGPFEHVDLSEFRETDEDDRLGQNAVPLHGFCLAGRSDELRNTCFPLAKAIDFFTLTYGSYPFPNYKLCFVDDLYPDILDTGCLSICSNRILFPEDVIEPLDRVSRQLVHALASQWIGVNITPQIPEDTWVVVGIAYFITDIFMKKLSGNNEYRFRQKKNAERLVDIDVARPPLYELGMFLQLDPSELDFMALKAPLVLFILDRRLTKASGSSGLSRIISRIFLNAKVGDLPNGAITTAYFVKTCEKLGHTKMDLFMTQWVHGAGCPRFRVTQKFNKKKLVVEMTIKQMQEESTEESLTKDIFMRDVKEEVKGVYAGRVQHVFNGPMTIRIHEADGTPYEHIVEIKDNVTKIDIPYNTKYKRLKRSRRHKERASTAAGNDATGEGNDDVLLYCLGDVLQTEEELREWKLRDWTKQEEDEMSSESYEWIRMDADFEWLCRIVIHMPRYMFVSQLQQDRDVVAQLESIRSFAIQQPEPLYSTILVRTLMDRRYFHGIRTAAAEALSSQAKPDGDWRGLYHLEKAFQELYCLPDSSMVRPNDFSDRAAYYVQCAIPKAIGKVQDDKKKSPFRARKFLRDKLVDNDNSNNEFSDSHYIATLLRSLAAAVSTNGKPRAARYDTRDDIMDESSVDERDDDIDFHHGCLEEIDRYRRMDEWIPSFNNVLSTTALDCEHRLAKANAAEFSLYDFLQYTREGTSDDLRISAFEAMMDLGLVEHDKALRWFLIVLGTDPSPYLREQMVRLLGKLLAALAIGEISISSTNLQAGHEGVAEENDGLIIENDGLTIENIYTDARKRFVDRTKTVTGALEALKEEIGGNETLRKGLWAAISSPAISLQQMGQLIDICSLLYTPNSSLIITLRYPRYWKCRHLGKGHLSFTHSARIRRTPIPQRQPPTLTALSSLPDSISSTPVPMLPPVKRSFSLKPPKRETPSIPSLPSIPSATSSLSSDSSANQPLANQTQSQTVPEGRTRLILKLSNKAKPPS